MKKSATSEYANAADEPSATSVSIFVPPCRTAPKPCEKNLRLMNITMTASSISATPTAT